MCLMHLGKIIVSIKIKVSCDIILEQIALNLTVLSTNCYDISSVWAQINDLKWDCPPNKKGK